MCLSQDDAKNVPHADEYWSVRKDDAMCVCTLYLEMSLEDETT